MKKDKKEGSPGSGMDFIGKPVKVPTVKFDYDTGVGKRKDSTKNDKG